MDMLAGYGSSSASESDSETEPPRLASGVNSAPTQAAATAPGAGAAVNKTWDTASAHVGPGPQSNAASYAPSSTLPSATALFATGASLPSSRYELGSVTLFVHCYTGSIQGS